MKRSILSHHLGRSVVLTPAQLRKNLRIDLNLGFGGCAIVHQLMQEGDSAEFSRVFQDMEAKTLVVGFNPGDGPSPFKDNSWKVAAQRIRKTAELVASLVDYGLSEPIMVGPIHTHHRTAFPEGVSEQESVSRWFKELNDIGADYGIIMACEPLNPIEQPCKEDPFAELFKACVDYPNIKIHWDTGHAHSRGKTWSDAKAYSQSIAFLELANVGRWPIGVKKGIYFEGYFEMIKTGDFAQAQIGVEPFCFDVINAFDLGEFCDTSYDGSQALANDAQTLRCVNLM